MVSRGAEARNQGDKGMRSIYAERRVIIIKIIFSKKTHNLSKISSSVTNILCSEKGGFCSIEKTNMYECLPCTRDYVSVLNVYR